jgi:hypothetical protein
MKVKLLKKVRKIYSIDKFDKVGTDGTASQLDAIRYGTFYGLYDSEMKQYVQYNHDYNTIYDYLVIRIKYEYKQYSKHYKTTTVKMWYNK